MTTKTVLVLANSVRVSPNHCVAGRELIVRGGRRAFGNWIRPVSTHGDGELAPGERTTGRGREVRVLDIVNMELDDHRPDRLQPENWTIGMPPHWELVGQATMNDLTGVSETPDSLWDELSDRPDRIVHQRIPDRGLSRSLYLVSVRQLAIRLFTETYREASKKKRRAIFEYRGLHYDLAITDPTVETRYGLRVPAASRPAVEYLINHSCCVCISLAHQPVGGHHYKLAAAIIDSEHL